MTTALQMKLCCTAQLIQAICLIGVCGLAGNHSKHQLPQLCCVQICNLFQNRRLYQEWGYDS